MKLENFVYIFIFVVLNCITKVTFAGPNVMTDESEKNFILNRIKNDTHTCINEEIFKCKWLRDCTILMPVEEDVESENPVFVLCMSLYDSFLLLCEKPQNKKLKEKIPQDLKQFNNLVESQRNQTVDKFCTAVKENGKLIIRNESFVKTARWINFFISSIQDKDVCLRICATVGGKSLEPLCYLIVWGNQLYSENRNSTYVLQASDNIHNIDNTHGNNDTPNNGSRPIIVAANTDTGSTKMQSKPNLPPNEEKSYDERGQVTPVLTQESQKNKKTTTNNNIASEEVQEYGLIKDSSQNKKPVDRKEKTDSIQPEPGKQTTKSELENDLVDKAGVPSEPNKMNIDDNVKDTNEGGGMDFSNNEEENNGNGGEFADGNAGADGMGDEDEDVQIQSSTKELLPVPVQNKQTLKEPSAHGGINTDVETDVEREVIVRGDPFVEAEDSHFFTYFISMAVLSIIVYLVFHNKKKLVALAVEGRRTRITTRRRPNTASYSKLDCNLEEAMVSNTTASVTHVLY